MLQNLSQRALVAWVVVSIFILHKIIWFFLYGIVCQMHEQIIQISFSWAYIFLSGESGQTFLKNKDTHWLHSIDKRVDSQVEF